MKRNIHIILVNRRLESDLIHLISAILALIACQSRVRTLLPDEGVQLGRAPELVRACLYNFKYVLIKVAESEVCVEDCLGQVLSQVLREQTDLLRGGRRSLTLLLQTLFKLLQLHVSLITLLPLLYLLFNV